MKKYMLSLCAMLSIGQCYSISTHEALMKLYSPVHTLPIEKVTYTWLKNLSNVVAEITTQAIQKSKDSLGRQDTDLITTAINISDITNEIVTLYLNVKTNIEQLKNSSAARSKIATTVSLLMRKLNLASQKISRSYITISKQQAQRSLQETIRFLNSPILTGIEQELNLLNPQHFA